MPKHPLELLSEATIRKASIWLLAAWALLTLLLVAVLPYELLGGITALAGAPDSAEASAIVASWRPALRAGAAFLVGFDFLYDLVHNNAVACACLWGATSGRPRHLLVARAFAWALWLCSLLNVPENLVYVRLLQGYSADPWVGLASAIASLRLVVLWSGFTAGGALLLLGHARWGRRAA